MTEKTVELYPTHYQVYELLKEGYQVKEVAEELFLNISYVYKIVGNLREKGLVEPRKVYEVTEGIKVKEAKKVIRKPLDKETVIKVGEMYFEDDKSINAIAQIMDISNHSVKKCVKNYLENI